jgi:RNA polymerase sigma factor (sigma-70 family)
MNPVLELDNSKSTTVGQTEKAFRPELFRPELLNYCRKLTRSIWDAEDLTQDTLLKSLPLITTHQNPKAYLFRIAKNAWIDHCRKQKEEMELTDQLDGIFDRDLIGVTEALSVLIKKLSPLQSVVFLLREVWAFSALEVAQVLGTTEGAVKSALHRARRKLDRLKDNESSEEIMNEIEETEHQKKLLNAFLNAFLNEDMEALLVLAQNDVIHPVHALSTLWDAEIQQKNKARLSSHTSLQAMAA